MSKSTHTLITEFNYRNDLFDVALVTSSLQEVQTMYPNVPLKLILEGKIMMYKQLLEFVEKELRLEEAKAFQQQRNDDSYNSLMKLKNKFINNKKGEK